MAIELTSGQQRFRAADLSEGHGDEESSSDDSLHWDDRNRSLAVQLGHEAKVVSDNPFENPGTWTWYDIFKFVVCGLTLLPLRLLAAVVLLLCALVVLSVAAAGLVVEQRQGCFSASQPLAPWRQRCLVPMALIFRGLLWCLGFWHIEIVDHRTQRDGPEPKLVVVAPHMTWADALVVSWVFPPFPAGVGDASILRAPFSRAMAVASQGIFVDVRNKESRASCRTVLKERASGSWAGPPVMIFPEGRITSGKRLIQFKLGAFLPGEPILPVTLRYPFKHFDPSSVGRNAGPLWPLRMMTQFVNHCRVEILDVYTPSSEEKANPMAFALEVRELMAMELPTTEHSYDDAFLYRLAGQNNITPDFEVQNMRDLFDVDLEQLSAWLKVFKSVDKDDDGVLGREDFDRVVQQALPAKMRERSSLNHIFRFFDTDGSGCIEYREFIQCLALFSGKCDAEAMAKLAFLVYDVEGDGRVRCDLLRTALDKGFAQNPRAMRTEPRHRESWRPCRGNCGLSAPESSEHCCFTCARGSGSHSPACEGTPAPSTWRPAQRLTSGGPLKNTVGSEVLSVRPPAAAGQGVGEVSSRELLDREELDLESFLELARQRPEVLEHALSQAYRRMGTNPTVLAGRSQSSRRPAPNTEGICSAV